jgi:hypothetical protein
LPKLVAVKQHPRYLLVENVRGFEVTWYCYIKSLQMTYWRIQNSHTRKILLSTLKLLGYTTIELLLTPLQFGIPNSRLRYYLLAKEKPLTFSCSQSFSDDYIWRHIPGHGIAWVDPRSLDDRDANSVVELSRYLDADVSTVNSHLYAVPDQVLRKWGKLFDIVLPSSRRSCCFTRGSIYFRWSIRTSILNFFFCFQDIHGWLNEQDQSCRPTKHSMSAYVTFDFRPALIFFLDCSCFWCLCSSSICRQCRGRTYSRSSPAAILFPFRTPAIIPFWWVIGEHLYFGPWTAIPVAGRYLDENKISPDWK